LVVSRATSRYGIGLYLALIILLRPAGSKAGSDSEDNNWNIVDSRSGQARPWEFTLVAPPGGTFRVHADGWEADGVNEAFGDLINPYASCDCNFQDQFNNLFGIETYLSGGRDDPIGELHHIFSCQKGVDGNDVPVTG
jgi:hypothetical protein